MTTAEAESAFLGKGASLHCIVSEESFPGRRGGGVMLLRVSGTGLSPGHLARKASASRIQSPFSAAGSEKARMAPKYSMMFCASSATGIWQRDQKNDLLGSTTQYPFQERLSPCQASRYITTSQLRIPACGDKVEIH